MPERPGDFAGLSDAEVDRRFDAAFRAAGVRDPVTIDVHTSRLAAARAYAHDHPTTYLALGLLAALAAPTVFIGGLLGLAIWYSLFG